MATLKDKLKKVVQAEAVTTTVDPSLEAVPIPTKKRRVTKAEVSLGERLIKSANEAAEIVKPKKPRAPRKPKADKVTAVEPVKQARRTCPHIARPLLESVSVLALHMHTSQQTDYAA